MVERTPLTAPLSIERIQELLPHRYPFLLVDRVVELSDDKIVAIKNVTINEPFFQGHFPGHPIMPGVLIIEAMAQVGGMLLLGTIEDPVHQQERIAVWQQCHDLADIHHASSRNRAAAAMARAQATLPR